MKKLISQRNIIIVFFIITSVFACKKTEDENTLQMQSVSEESNSNSLNLLNNTKIYSKTVNVYDATGESFVAVRISTSSEELLNEYTANYEGLQCILIPESEIDKFMEKNYDYSKLQETTDTIDYEANPGYVNIDFDFSNVIKNSNGNMAITFIDKYNSNKTVWSYSNLQGNPILNCTFSPACDALIITNLTDYWCSNCLCHKYNAFWEAKTSGGSLLSRQTSTSQLELESFSHPGQIGKLDGWPGYDNSYPLPYSGCQATTGFSAKCNMLVIYED